MEKIRLNKYLSEAGVCSRREADRLIEEGHVRINGEKVQLGQKVSEDDYVTIDGKPVVTEKRRVILMLNKPKGIVCTAEKSEPNNIVDYVDYPVRVYPVGRLDKESRGLILMTNEGELVNALNRARNYHEKEYIVKVDREVTADFIKQMSGGIYLPELGRKTRRCQVKKISHDRFSIVLTQGLNRQIRRMCESCGYRVRDLKRVRIQNLTLGDLKEGEYRELTEDEINRLFRSIGLLK